MDLVRFTNLASLHYFTDAPSESTPNGLLGGGFGGLMGGAGSLFKIYQVIQHNYCQAATIVRGKGAPSCWHPTGGNPPIVQPTVVGHHGTERIRCFPSNNWDG